ncbi:HD domain-containing protein [Rubritalea halochordaticola]
MTSKTPMKEVLHQPHTPDLNAAIHIGASSISLLAMTDTGSGQMEHVDFLQQSTPIAHDVFSKGKLSRKTIERCVSIIQGFIASLQELGIEPNNANTRLVATNILSEATNKDIFLNRIRISCGINIEILDDGEMTRLIYLKTRRRLSDTPSMQKRTTLILHVGPGNTRAILFRNGRIEHYSNYRLGTHRTSEAVDSILDDQKNSRKVIREHVSGQLDLIREDYGSQGIQDIVLIGYEIQLVSAFIQKSQQSTTQCSLQHFSELCRQAASMGDDELVAHFRVDYQTAEALLPALEINLTIARALNIDTIHIPGSDYEKGLLQDLYSSTSLSEEFTEEVVRSAESIAAKYRVNNQHAKHVAYLCRTIFEQTQELHSLTDQDALLLHIAAILHECGGFISSRAHHKHSQYIIQNCEIFGLAYTDIELIALVARYHRNSEPKPGHSGYRELNDEDRMRVCKLAAILRVADALERTHSARIKDLEIRISKRRIHFLLKNITDANVERLAMRSKGNLFENIFGLEINLVEDK